MPMTTSVTMSFMGTPFMGNPFIGIPFLGIIVPIWVYILVKVKNIIGDNYFAE